MGFSTVAKVVASVVIAGAGFAGGMKAAPVFGIGSGQDQGAEPVVTVDTTLVKNSFADIGELATESYNFTQVGKYSEEGTKVFGMEVPGTGAHYLITYSGEVKAGVADVSQIQVEVDEVGHVVTVTVPAVEVLSASIDPASVETYDQSFSIVNQIEVGEVTTFLGGTGDRRRRRGYLQGTARQGAGACGRHCEEAGQRCSWRAGQQVRGARRHCLLPR